MGLFIKSSASSLVTHPSNVSDLIIVKCGVCIFSYEGANPVFAKLINGIWSDDAITLNSDLGGAVFKSISGNIKSGMNGIYIGKFDNGALIPTETNVFENCIYLIGSSGNQTAVYAFTIGQYASGHLFFNRMTSDNIWQLNEWKKLI